MNDEVTRLRADGVRLWMRAEHWRETLERIRSQATDPTIIGLIEEAFQYQSDLKEF